MQAELILNARLPYSQIRMPKDYMAYRVRVTGGLGGRTSEDIAKQRANAIKVLANLLQVSIVHVGIALYLVRFEGGESADCIPGSAEALVAFPAEREQEFYDLLIQGSCAVQAQFGVTDPDVEVLFEPAPWHGTVIDEESTRCLLADLNAIPVGPLEWHPEQLGTPLTSNNIGTVHLLSDVFEIAVKSCSYRDEDLSLLVKKIREILLVSGADVTEVNKA